MIKLVEAHEVRNNWTLMKKNEVNNKHKNKDSNINDILSSWTFRCKRSPYGRLIKIYRLSKTPKLVPGNKEVPPPCISASREETWAPNWNI